MTEKEDIAIASQSESETPPDDPRDLAPSTRADPDELPSSDSIAGGIYQFVSVLASGGAGVVYKAENLHLGKPVAIKMIRDAALSGSDVEARFLQEARATSHLSHPNIVSIYEFGTSVDGRPFIVMEWIEGTSLGALIKKDGPLKLETSLSIFEQICDAMTHAHKRGVLHRDLKPSNIMLTPNFGDPEGAWQVHIIDFGIAKVIEQIDKPQLTQTGDVFGTPVYMSPEQGSGKKVDHRSDLYSLGCLMYETLTGRPPFCGDTAVALLIEHQSADIPSINAHTSKSSRFPQALDKLIQSLLAKLPEDRPQSIEQVKKSFDAIRNPVTEKKQPVLLKAVATTLKSKVFLALVSCLIVGIVWGSFTMKSEPPAPVKFAELHTANHRESDEQARKDAQTKPSVERLTYENSELTDEGLKYLQPLWNLKYLSVRESLITDKGVKYLERLPLLKLDISSTRITDESLEILSKITTLKELKLSETSIQGLNHKLRLLESMKQLELLDVAKLQLKDEQIADLEKLTSLKVLKISHNPDLTNTSLASVAKLKHLKQLCMRRGHFHGAFKLLKPLKEIEYLELTDSAVQDADLKAVSQLSSLQALNLNGTHITDSGMHTLAVASLPMLEELSVAETKTTEKGIREFRVAHPGCKVFTQSSQWDPSNGFWQN